MSSPTVLLRPGEPFEAALGALAASGNLPPFGPAQQAFAAALSRALVGDAATRAHPELVALGYWLRPAHQQRLGLAAGMDSPGARALPRGLVFHVAPANVDSLFAYSWMLSMLCGNRNVVRLSSQEGPQSRALLGLLGRLFAAPEWQAIASRTLLLRYGHELAISERLSAACDLRVIWGGDHTVQTLRRLPLPPHATEMCFPNKLSLAVLQADSVAAADDAVMRRLATALHNDAYWFDQMACASPRLVVWVGSDAHTRAVAASRLWTALARELEQRQAGIEASAALDKRIAADRLALAEPGVHIVNDDPRITRVELPTPAWHDELHCGAGLFHECQVPELAGLLPLLSRRVQTLVHHGFSADEWHVFLQRHLPPGIDRIVPLGEALNFDRLWDGLDLRAGFLRQVVVR
jgi:Acyl-CoA reductase (LuxC)